MKMTTINAITLPTFRVSSLTYLGRDVYRRLSTNETLYTWVDVVNDLHYLIMARAHGFAPRTAAFGRMMKVLYDYEWDWEAPFPVDNLEDALRDALILWFRDKYGVSLFSNPTDDYEEWVRALKEECGDTDIDPVWVVENKAKEAPGNVACWVIDWAYEEYSVSI